MKRHLLMFMPLLSLALMIPVSHASAAKITKASLDSIVSTLNAASAEQKHDTFIKALDNYLADDVKIHISTRSGNAIKSVLPKQQTLTKEEYIDGMTMTLHTTKNYRAKLSMTAHKIISDGTAASFTVSSQESGIAAYNGSEGKPVHFIGSYSCKNKAEIREDHLKITSVNCSGRSRILPQKPNL